MFVNARVASRRPSGNDKVVRQRLMEPHGSVNVSTAGGKLPNLVDIEPSVLTVKLPLIRFPLSRARALLQDITPRTR